MKLRTVATMAAAGALAAHALAQSAPAPAGGSPAPATPPARTAAPSDRPVDGANDPRRCLEFSTNIEIHTCAEKYRPRKRAG